MSASGTRGIKARSIYGETIKAEESKSVSLVSTLQQPVRKKIKMEMVRPKQSQSCLVIFSHVLTGLVMFGHVHTGFHTTCLHTGYCSG